MACPSTSYISKRDRGMLRNNWASNKERLFYTRLIDWSLLEKGAVREDEVLRTGTQQVPGSS